MSSETAFRDSSRFLRFNMKPELLFCIVTVSWIKGVTLSKDEQVFQSPAELLGQPGDEVSLTVAHEIPSYDTVLWYQHSPGDTALKLVAYIYYKIPKVEPPFESHFKVSGDGEKKAHLHILNLTHSEDSGDYFGAASLHDVVAPSSLVIQQSPENLKSKAGQRMMDLIGLLCYENPNLEKNFEKGFNMTGHSKGKAQLTVKHQTYTCIMIEKHSPLSASKKNLKIIKTFDFLYIIHYSCYWLSW
ncbi:uncharacterized protein [Nothobranchius furzeri]|uniref:uncharacterized protein n=1 Tax=Nothobranchius furzeri TaxID=105023 RepID=UPI0039047775